MNNSFKESFQGIVGIAGMVLKDTSELQTVLFSESFHFISVNNGILNRGSQIKDSTLPCFDLGTDCSFSAGIYTPFNLI